MYVCVSKGEAEYERRVKLSQRPVICVLRGIRHGFHTCSHRMWSNILPNLFVVTGDTEHTVNSNSE